ncbi:MAG: zinc ribbon domain-containing protein [Leucobacter sp.]
MKASPRQQQLLLDLQELDTSILRLRRKRDQVPERTELDALSGETGESRDSFMAAQRALDTHRVELERIESDVAVVEQRRKRDDELLAVSTSSKEAQAIQSELDVLQRRQTELEDRQLEAMEVLETAQATFADAEAVMAGVESRRADVQERLSEAERVIDVQLQANSDEREGVAAELQRDVLELYEATRARNGIGAARLRGNVSEGSNMALAPGELAGIRAAAPDEIVFCPGSGAILVRDTAESDA